MKDKKEIAKLIYDGLKKRDIKLALSLISVVLNFFLNNQASLFLNKARHIKTDEYLKSSRRLDLCRGVKYRSLIPACYTSTR